MIDKKQKLKQGEAVDEDEEEDSDDYYDELFLEDLESGSTGSILDQAETFIKDFSNQKIKMTPLIEGYLIYRKGSGMLAQ